MDVTLTFTGILLSIHMTNNTPNNYVHCLLERSILECLVNVQECTFQNLHPICYVQPYVTLRGTLQHCCTHRHM